MGRWPDPILRRPASPVSESFLASPTLTQVCQTLQRVARQEEAVGLAAQQCGIDARVVYLDSPRPLWIINPRIVNRSPEESMKVWEEACLVLPASFKATVLRDAWIDVQYWTPQGTLQLIRFKGEPARCIQHEMDHDRGVLTLDHIGFEEMENDYMREIEASDHTARMQLAYAREIVEPIAV